MIPLSFILILFVAFQAKHFLVDYPLQAHPYFLGKFRPGWDFFWPLALHAGCHGLATFSISVWAMALMTGHGYRATEISRYLPLGLACFDAMIHFIMDRIKASPCWMGRWKPLTATEYVECQHLVDTWYPGTADRDGAAKRLRGNRLFWISLGFDQMVHHLTDYVVITALLVLW